MSDDNTAIAQFVRKIERRRPLPEVDRAALLALPVVVKLYEPNETVLQKDVTASHCAIVAKGLVSRVKELENGARQIVALYIAGDAVDLQSILFVKTDHVLCAHSPTEVAWIAYKDFLDLFAQRPAIAHALWLDTLIDASIFREWTANLGQRSARERTAHFVLEMAARLDTIGQLKDNSFELPLTQNAIAEAMGLSLVHMNKSLQTLKQAGLLATRGRRITLLNRSGLIELTGFSSSYLHLDQALIKSVDEVTSFSEASCSQPVSFQRK